MRGLFTVLFFLFFLFTFPLAVYTFTINNFLKPEYIKTQLAENEVYVAADSVVSELIDRGDETDEETEEKLIPNEELEAELKKFVQEEVDPAYIQSKVEPFVDQTFSWLSRDRDEPPQISFADLVEKVEAQPNAVSVPTDVRESLSDPMEFNPGNAEVLKTWYGWLTLAPIVFGTLSLLLLVGIVLLAKDWKPRLRKAALAFFLPTFFGFIGVGVIVFAGQIIKELARGAAKQSLPVLEEPILDVVNSIFQDVAVMLLIIFGSALVLSIILFVISFFIPREKKEESRNDAK